MIVVVIVASLVIVVPGLLIAPWLIDVLVVASLSRMSCNRSDMGCLTGHDNGFTVK